MGDAKQLDVVDEGSLASTREMRELLRISEVLRMPRVVLAGDVRRAFEKLGSNVAEVQADNLAGAAAARWLALPPEERERAGLMAPSHKIREEINAIVRERLVREGAVCGPAFLTNRLVSRGYTNPEKSLAANYSPGDVVAFHRPYKRIGVDKGDELRVTGVDHESGAVILQGRGGGEVRWDPERQGTRPGQQPGRRGDGHQDRFCRGPGASR